MKEIILVSAGKIGGAIATMLAETGDYKVTVVDRSGEQLAEIDHHPTISSVMLDITDQASLLATIDRNSLCFRPFPSI
ncbi:saccharopine dehydrogenase NADP-binding domain-containing protein [Bradyrhizobium sp. C-145]|uniref:saccharopine dehydrogenase NADP-binding domain-containing protein n=1 Tax=Bradyrhizobium sp. C-145 TaxID=574727 RepID=UPI00201B595C|nr:saccharopine dehydrogenase NADP-binding domain-containing protein [Bradyrhizobium sp. C-145]UQR61476.1 saccharopine dehydrogenase NADP-binding domain-containing protein [Bradyrhizobium sp. C-145]